MPSALGELANAADSSGPSRWARHVERSERGADRVQSERHEQQAGGGEPVDGRGSQRLRGAQRRHGSRVPSWRPSADASLEPTDHVEVRSRPGEASQLADAGRAGHVHFREEAVDNVEAHEMEPIGS